MIRALTVDDVCRCELEVELTVLELVEVEVGVVLMEVDVDVGVVEEEVVVDEEVAVGVVDDDVVVRLDTEDEELVVPGSLPLSPPPEEVLLVSEPVLRSREVEVMGDVGSEVSVFRQEDFGQKTNQRK